MPKHSPPILNSTQVCECDVACNFFLPTPADLSVATCPSSDIVLLGILAIIGQLLDPQAPSVSAPPTILTSASFDLQTLKVPPAYASKSSKMDRVTPPGASGSLLSLGFSTPKDDLDALYCLGFPSHMYLNLFTALRIMLQSQKSIEKGVAKRESSDQYCSWHNNTKGALR
jgi:hypothetical protein